jgi:hypothetical protein
MKKNKIILFNPKSANGKHRIPNSILQVGASVHGHYDYVFVDGNVEKNPWETIENYLKTGDYKYFGYPKNKSGISGNHNSLGWLFCGQSV